MTEPVNVSSQKSTNRPAWSKCAIFVMVAMLIGARAVVVGFLYPYWWLAPPLFQYTPLIYVSLMVSWAFVFIICLARRPSGSKIIPAVLLGLGLLQTIFGLLIIGPIADPNVGLAPLVAQEVSCESLTLPEDKVRYRCTVKNELSLETSETYVLEEADFLPVLWLVEYER